MMGNTETEWRGEQVESLVEVMMRELLMVVDKRSGKNTNSKRAAEQEEDSSAKTTAMAVLQIVLLVIRSSGNSLMANWSSEVLKDILRWLSSKNSFSFFSVVAKTSICKRVGSEVIHCVGLDRLHLRYYIHHSSSSIIYSFCTSLHTDLPTVVIIFKNHKN